MFLSVSTTTPRPSETIILRQERRFWLSWQVTVAVGLFVGPVVPADWNLGFAIPILFIGLIVMGIDKWPKLTAALVGAGVTYLASGLPSRGGLLVGAFAGIVAGTIVEKYRA